MRKVLLICEHIAPEQAVASIRWTKIAKYLKANHDVQISVLTNKKYYDLEKDFVDYKIDKMLEKEMKVFDNYYEGECNSYFKMRKVFRVFKNIIKRKPAVETSDIKTDNNTKVQAVQNVRLQRSLREAFIYELKTYLDAHDLRKYILKKNLDYDVVVSSYGPAWTHLVAEKVKKKNKKTFWIADFRDPYAQVVDPPLFYKRHKKFTSKHCKKADVLTVVLEEMTLFQKKEQRVELLTNGYDPAEAKEPLKPVKFDSVFTGELYSGRRDLSEFFHALRELIDEGKIDEKDIVVHYAGKQNEIIIAQAEKWNMQNNVEAHGYVSREKSLALQQSAAILIQASWNTVKEKTCWTGKMYEYMMAKKPIVYMVEGDEPYSLPSKLMHRLGGVCYEKSRYDETYPEMKKYILNKYLEWKSTGNVTIDAEEEYIRQYEYPEIAEKVWKFFTE